MRGLPHASKPCTDCPWRVDSDPDQFPLERFEQLRCSAGAPGREAGLGAPMFACHKTAEGKEIACAGWLAVEGHDHLGVRLAVLMGRLPACTLKQHDGWPALYGSYAEMADAKQSRPAGQRA